MGEDNALKQYLAEIAHEEEESKRVKVFNDESEEESYFGPQDEFDEDYAFGKNDANEFSGGRGRQGGGSGGGGREETTTYGSLDDHYNGEGISNGTLTCEACGYNTGSLSGGLCEVCAADDEEQKQDNTPEGQAAKTPEGKAKAAEEKKAEERGKAKANHAKNKEKSNIKFDVVFLRKYYTKIRALHGPTGRLLDQLNYQVSSAILGASASIFFVDHALMWCSFKFKYTDPKHTLDSIVEVVIDGDGLVGSMLSPLIDLLDKILKDPIVVKITDKIIEVLRKDPKYEKIFKVAERSVREADKKDEKERKRKEEQEKAKRRQARAARGK